MLVVAGSSDPSRTVRYQIDTPVASATTNGPGEYRVALLSAPGGPEIELAVFRGSTSLSTEHGSTTAGAGERTLARDLAAPSYPFPFNSARFDAFDRWLTQRREARLGTRSAQYLPRDLHMYSGTFDRYGSWYYQQPHGYVWYPAVAPTWRPYYRGYWASLRPYGWTWIGHDIRAWPTHHYGRWGFAQNKWFWIPDRHWAPAWVAWSAAPGFVGWCPLGFDGGPVFALTMVFGNPWTGWVQVPSPFFGGYEFVAHKYAVAPEVIPANTSFTVSSKPPVSPPHAVPRLGMTSPQSAAIATARQRNCGVAGPRSLVVGPQPALDSRRSSVGSRRAAPSASRTEPLRIPPSPPRPSRSASPPAMSATPRGAAPRAAPAQQAPGSGGAAAPGRRRSGRP